MNKKLIPFLTIIAVLFFCLTTCTSTCKKKSSKRDHHGRIERIENRKKHKEKQESLENIEKRLALIREDSIKAARQLVIDSIEKEMHILRHDSVLTATIQERNAGSAKILAGRICVYSVFAQGQNYQWTDEEIALWCKKVTDACDWLRKQAELWTGDQMKNGRYYYLPEFTCVFSDSTPVMLPKLPKMEDSFDTRFRMCSKIVKEKGFPDMYSINERLKTYFNCEQLVVLFICKGDGRSFSSPTTSELVQYNPKKYTTEYCILFSQYEGDDEYSRASGSISHEILHAFGGWDLYEVTPKMKKLASRAKLLFPNSIMIDVCNEEDKSIDELNAFLVGLHNNPKAYYRYFETE